MNECCLCRRQLIYSTATQGVLLSIVSARTKGLPVPPSAMSKYSNHCEESDDKGDNDQPRAKRGKKYSKIELESESSDEGVNDQPQITSFLHCQAPYFTLRVVSSQLQQGNCDCAHVAIATATSLCHGESRNSIHWDQMLMWTHHSKSFELYRKDDAIS